MDGRNPAPPVVADDHVIMHHTQTPFPQLNVELVRVVQDFRHSNPVSGNPIRTRNVKMGARGQAW